MLSNIIKSFTRWCTAPVIKLTFPSQSWTNPSTFHTLLFDCDLVLCLDGKKCFFHDLQWLELPWAWIGNPVMNFPNSSWLFNKLPLVKLRRPLEIMLKGWACWALDLASSKAYLSQLLLYHFWFRTLSIILSMRSRQIFLRGGVWLLKREVQNRKQQDNQYSVRLCQDPPDRDSVNTLPLL